MSQISLGYIVLQSWRVRLKKLLQHCCVGINSSKMARQKAYSIICLSLQGHFVNSFDCFSFLSLESCIDKSSVETESLVFNDLFQNVFKQVKIPSSDNFSKLIFNSIVVQEFSIFVACLSKLKHFYGWFQLKERLFVF